jgi:NodT family efflux transporter outer membrane factor (OMF) lipoprotein
MIVLSRALAAGMLAAFALTGCRSGPDYERPRQALAPYHNHVVPHDNPVGAAAPAPPLDAWWTGFHDGELTLIVERALAQNLDLAAALARVDQARAVARENGAQLLPSAALQVAVSPLRQSLDSPIGTIAKHSPGYHRDQVLYDAGGGASWELDLSGGLHRNVESAEALAQAAEAAHMGTRISVAADAADAYLQIRGYQARLACAEGQIATDAHLLILVRLRQAGGVATDREVAQADALMSQARALIPPLKRGSEAQLNRLDVLLGAQAGTYARELAVAADIPAIPAVDPGNPGDLLRRRPDIIAAERRLAASNAQIGAALSEYYPKVSLSALLGFESLSRQNLFTGAGFQPEAMAGLHWRLFDFGRVDSEVAAARGANAEALANYRASVLHATEDVENALTGLVQSAAEVRELTRETAALQRAADAAEEAYRAGAVSLIDVLDSDRQRLVAQDDLARVRADTARAAVSSYRALGGGW